MALDPPRSRSHIVRALFKRALWGEAPRSRTGAILPLAALVLLALVSPLVTPLSAATCSQLCCVWDARGVGLIAGTAPGVRNPLANSV